MAHDRDGHPAETVINLLQRSTAVLSFAAAALAASTWANPVVNPGFETGTFAGSWTRTPAASGSFFGVAPQTSGSAGIVDPRSGSYLAYFGETAGLPEAISQEIATVPGTSYAVSYYLADNGNGQGAFTASFDGASQTLGALTTAYRLQTLAFTATATSTTLGFAGYVRAGFYNLDDVSVVANPVPESVSIAALDLGAIALLRRRQTTGTTLRRRRL